ncbi:uncharacterized protein ASPGLDRAFT_1254890 [Aspergillus glaucus CBS 516.65]|uniref:Uncharacterized protein n=1 Tax=Aspergillus glaucus CBS 516.65 TaxID=1160497 RepID=A0A1L9VRY0_ASPGL|nr:hypothetical protein ASPGLDRAFT_1254890 [Aspergillus glaucus CBS 516.65]OJJ86650.1 hypothetical protein ASPGLDRAFT_1254890 [Aspergillus glaucus CBS 516.65]
MRCSSCEPYDLTVVSLMALTWRTGLSMSGRCCLAQRCCMKFASAPLSRRQYADFGPWGVSTKTVNVRCFRSVCSGCSAAMPSTVAAPSTGPSSFLACQSLFSMAHCGIHLVGVVLSCTSNKIEVFVHHWDLFCAFHLSIDFLGDLEVWRSWCSFSLGVFCCSSFSWHC